MIHYPPTIRATPKVIQSKPTGWIDSSRRSFPSPERIEEADITFPEDILGKDRVNYDVMMLHGKRGDGKSATATLLLYWMKKVWEEMGCYDYRVATNYHVSFADICHPYLIDQIIDFPDWCYKLAIGVDELATFFPSLRSTSTKTLRWQTFLQQIRKIKCSLVFTTQFPTYVGAGSNIQINWYVKPHMYHEVYNRKLKAYVPNAVSLDFVDWFGSQTGWPIQHRWPPWPQDAAFTRTLSPINFIFEHYDTDEVVAPFFIDEHRRDQMIGKTWEAEIEAEQEQKRKDAENEAAVALKQARESAERHLSNGGTAKTLEDLVERQGGEFALSTIFDEARQLGVPNTKYLADALEEMGYRVFNGGGGRWAVKD